MGVAGHRLLGVLIGGLSKCNAYFAKELYSLLEFFFLEEPHHHKHLIVPASPRMNLFAKLAASCRKILLDRRMAIFLGLGNVKITLLPFLLEILKSLA